MEPFAFHNKLGDMIEAHWSKDDYYAKYLNEQITLFISENTKEIIGVEISGIKRLINETPPVV